MFLVADVGGTKTEIALFNGDICVQERKFSSPDYFSLEALLEDFFQGKKFLIDRAVFGVPGIVLNGECIVTNLPWTVSNKKLSKMLNAEVFLLNDLESSAYGIEILEEKDFFVLNRGIFKKGNRILISAGTGLGEAAIVEGSVIASEGGHTDFAVKNEEEFNFFSFMQKKYGHVSYERVLSGRGLVDLYEFLTLSGENIIIENPILISQKAVQKKCSVCERALDMFISFYARETANLALKFLASGGIYLGGGIAPKILDRMKDIFMDSYLDKGRFAKWLKEIPVKVIINERAPILGAINYIKKNGL